MLENYSKGVVNAIQCISVKLWLLLLRKLLHLLKIANIIYINLRASLTIYEEISRVYCYCCFCCWIQRLWTANDCEKKKFFGYQRKVYHFIFRGLFPPFSVISNFNHSTEITMNQMNVCVSWEVGSITLKSELSAVIEQSKGILFVRNCSATPIVRTMDNVQKLNSVPFFIHFFPLSTAIVHLFFGSV